MIDDVILEHVCELSRAFARTSGTAQAEKIRRPSAANVVVSQLKETENCLSAVLCSGTK